MDDSKSLRICPNCDCRLCFESGAEPLTPDSWLIVVQCPNCWHAWRRTINDVELELFEDALDDDRRVIAAEVEDLAWAIAVAEAEQLEMEVARFVAALEVDAILPVDF